MEDESTRFSYTPHALVINASSAAIAICLIAFFYITYLNFTVRHHGQPSFSNTFLIVFIICCCISYFVAAVLAFYSKRLWQNYIPAWLTISFFGSVIFSVLSGILAYIKVVEEIKNYREPPSTSMFSGSSPRPEHPTLEKFVVEVLILALVLFLITGLVSSVSSFVAGLLSKKKEEPYTLMEL